MPDLPTATLDPNCDWSDDMDQIAHGALSGLHYNTNDEHEQAGVIFSRPDGKYCYSTPMTMQGRDEFALRAPLTNGMKLAGIYHTHPGDDELGQVFSPKDLDVAHQLNVPSYILFEKTGNMAKYIPGQTATSRMDSPGSPFGLKVAKGDPLQFKSRTSALAAAFNALQDRKPGV